MTKKEKRIIQNYYDVIQYLENNKRYCQTSCNEYTNDPGIKIKRHIILQAKLICYSVVLNKLKRGV